MNSDPGLVAPQAGTFGPLLKLAIPVMAEEFLNLLVGFTDWWLTGRYLETTEHKAAMSLIAYVLWLLPSLFSAVSIGATALIARLVGAGDRAGANRVMHQAFVVGAFMAAAATIGVGFGAELFLKWMRLDATATPLALQYINILVWVVPAIMAEQVAIASLRGAGDTTTGFLAKVTVNLVNAVLCAGLVTGWSVFPNLGWRGLAIGASVGHFVGACLLLGVLFHGRAGLIFRFSQLQPVGSLIRRLLRVGLPGGIDILSILACHLAYFSIINTLGKNATAGHGLGVQIESLAYCPGSAFQVAIATIAGQLMGAGDTNRAARSIRHTCAAAVSFYSLAGLVFYFLGLQLAQFFTADSQDSAAQLAAGYLSIVAVSMPSLALVAVLSGALRGVGDTAWPLAITFVGLVLVRIPVACWLSWDQMQLPVANIELTGMGLGVYGAWYAMVIDMVIRSLLFVGRFVHGGWKHVRV